MRIGVVVHRRHSWTGPWITVGLLPLLGRWVVVAIRRLLYRWITEATLWIRVSASVTPIICRTWAIVARWRGAVVLVWGPVRLATLMPLSGVESHDECALYGDEEACCRQANVAYVG